MARLPVGDLARLAAVAAFAARAADGEGGLIVSRESAADVARSSTPCSNNGTRRMARRAAPAPFVDLFFALAPLTRRLGAARPCGMLPQYRDIYDS